MNNTNFLPAPQLSHEEEKVFENAFNEAIKQHQGNLSLIFNNINY